MTTDESRRPGALGRVRKLCKVDPFVWVLLGTSTVAALLIIMVFAQPGGSVAGVAPTGSFVAFSIEAKAEEDTPDWTKSPSPTKGASASRREGSEGKIGGRAIEDTAERAGVLGMLSRSSLAQVLGQDAEEVLEKLVEHQIGESYGVAGLSVEPISTARDAVDVPFRPASGYWANSYVPGDPMVRLLKARIAEADQKVQNLDRVARPYSQAFDPPQSSALSVFLQSDRQRAAGKTRMLLQVGLQGTQRRAGRRPEMNVTVVLDWRSQSSATIGASIRALVMALASARDIGDRFTLIAAGLPRAVVVEGKDFRHGPLTIALQRLFSAAKEDEALSLLRAYEQATATFDPDDPAAPLSSNLLLLVATGSFRQDAQLVARLRQSVAAGIPTSVVGVGHSVDAEQLTRLAIAGQGSRRLLVKPAEAQALVDSELLAAASVVARAVRLRIRLAAGVQLVDILGSYPLGEVQSQRVRLTEQRIDQRVAKKLGVAADRGEDEEGIQIVIPALYAGDSHVILLDVVASGPGAVADVTVRYKDLVFLRNGVARAQLALPRGADSASRGPLQMSVVKNLLSHRTSEALRQAASLLRREQPDAAAKRLSSSWLKLSELQRTTPALHRDPDIARDLELLEVYRMAVRRIVVGHPQQAQLMSGSLQLAAHYKAHRRSEQ